MALLEQVGLREPRQAPAQRAVRRPAAARGDRARAGDPAADRARRRADREPRLGDRPEHHRPDEGAEPQARARPSSSPRTTAKVMAHANAVVRLADGKIVGPRQRRAGGRRTSAPGRRHERADLDTLQAARPDRAPQPVRQPAQDAHRRRHHLLRRAASSCVGSSLLDSIDAAMSRSIIGSVAGHIQVYSAKSKDELALFGGMGRRARPRARSTTSRKIKAALREGPQRARRSCRWASAARWSPRATPSTSTLARAARARAASSSAERRLDAGAAGADRQPEGARAADRRGAASDRKNARASSDERAIDAGGRRGGRAKARCGPRSGPTSTRDRSDTLEFLENQLAPQAADADLLFLRYVGTDLDDFPKALRPHADRRRPAGARRASAASCSRSSSTRSS